MMKTFWNAFGRALAKVAKYAGEGALWASQHPQVIADIATLAGKPAIAAAVTQAAPVAEAAGAAIAAATKQ